MPISAIAIKVASMFYNTPDPTAPRRNRAKTWIIRLLITFIVVWVFWIAFISLLSQAKHIPKEEIERTLSDSTGLEVTIGALRDFTLYPSVRFAAEDVVIARHDNEGMPLARLGLLDVGMDFKQAAFYQGNFQHLIVAGLSLSGAPYGLPDILIETNKVKLGEELSRMTLAGKLGDEKIRIVMPLLREENDNGKDDFRFSGDRAITIVLGDAVMEGKLLQTATGFMMQPFRVAGQSGVLSLNRAADESKPVDVVLALPQLQATQLTDPSQPLAEVLGALLPPPREMREVPDALEGARLAIRISIEQWMVNNQKQGSVTLAWIYKNGRWIQPVIATHKLSPVGLQDVQTMLMDLATGKVPEKPAAPPAGATVTTTGATMGTTPAAAVPSAEKTKP